jgi:DNA-binding MarR family transcriptional regulator
MNKTSELTEVRAKRFTEIMSMFIQHSMRLQDLAKDQQDFSRQEILTTHILGEHGPSTMGFIAERLHLAFSSVTSLVDKMVEKQLVCRERSTTDRRVVQVKLSPKGKRFYENMLEEHISLSREIISGLSEKDQETFIRLFEKAAEHIMDVNLPVKK